MFLSAGKAWPGLRSVKNDAGAAAGALLGLGEELEAVLASLSAGCGGGGEAGRLLMLYRKLVGGGQRAERSTRLEYHSDGLPRSTPADML